MKGELEDGLCSLDFERLSLFRPSVLVTPNIRYGLQDRITQWLFPKLSAVLPSRLREVTVDELAVAMWRNAERPGRGVAILHHDDFITLVREGK